MAAPVDHATSLTGGLKRTSLTRTLHHLGTLFVTAVVLAFALLVCHSRRESAVAVAFAVVLASVFLVCHSERSERTCFLPFFVHTTHYIVISTGGALFAPQRRVPSRQSARQVLVERSASRDLQFDGSRKNISIALTLRIRTTPSPKGAIYPSLGRKPQVRDQQSIKR